MEIKKWYNIQADLKRPVPPPRNPETHEPVTPEELAPLFPRELILQEVSTTRYISIPDEVKTIYSTWRPTPLLRAKRLEKYLKTPARIFYKYEGVSPPGSHKPNTAVAQAYYNYREGIDRLATETGAGQWGSALSFACNHFGLECTVYMVKVSYDQKPYRKSLMELWGAHVFASPSNRTNAGREILKEDPDSPGSLGVAISEAVEDAAAHEDTKYSLGSVLNHVLLHQTVIGLEAQQQLKEKEISPDIVIGCCGGGSNFAGLSFPFVHDVLRGHSMKIIAVEPEACPTLTRGLYLYDFGDTAQLTPLVKMYTLGHTFIPPKIHAGGLRYHGDAPLVSMLYKEGLIDAEAYKQNDVFEAADIFAKTEGLIAAPETAHAVKSVIHQALLCKERAEEKTILFNFSGHGYFDLSAYDAYYSGQLLDYEYPSKLIEESLKTIPVIP
ncbi:MAG: TrpB-like pyridoxal phosphate-dependent enzyme [Theionarchaea archaeon]|nr:TrpB-like pyridoxal phosphate-dependent enzyme [Theionarchaea archaeon]